MGEEIAFENGRISDFRGLVTLTLDRVILHTVIHHSSTSTYMPNFIKIEETFCVRMHIRTGGNTFETHFMRWTRRSRPNKDRVKSLFMTFDIDWKWTEPSIICKQYVVEATPSCDGRTSDSIKPKTHTWSRQFQCPPTHIKNANSYDRNF